MTFRATRWILKHGIRENIMYVVFLNTTLSKFKYHACDNQVHMILRRYAMLTWVCDGEKLK